jgi:dihydropyrimidinase/allantoinase
MTVDLVLKNGKILLPEGVFEGGIAIDEGKIVSIGKEGNLPTANETIDVEGNIIVPGVIDIHSHLRDMDRSDWEDFESGTKAAAAGGVTTAIEMPLTLPPTTNVETFLDKKNRVENKAIVNMGLYAGAGTHNLEEIPLLHDNGAIAFKTFTHPPPKGRENDFLGLYVTDDGSHLNVLEQISKKDALSVVHAENWQIGHYYSEKIKAQGGKDLVAYLKSKPGITEAEAIQRVSYFADYTHTRLHICHVCSKEAIGVLKRIKASGLMITAETCPHYLAFSIDNVKHLGPYAKINPPIREREHVNELWKALNDGTIDAVASDHGPFPREVKELGWGDIWKAYMGSPGIDTMFPVMLTQMNKGLISLERLIKVLSENPARIFGLYPADIVVVNLKKKNIIDKEKSYSKAKDIALLYDGYEVQGIPTHTIVNGKIVMHDGEVFGKPGTGKFVTNG